ncbi:hypothetical protein ZWY2020_058744 [Hordeum vulgare]|nr:hypothetical protein ZWY2020_058744 [Hordeum vulgare]
MHRGRSNPKLSSPCSLKAVHKVISRFSSTRSSSCGQSVSGLAGAATAQEDWPQVLLWLLTKVVPDSTVASHPAAAGKVAGMPFYPNDVSKVFGVPSGGCPVPKLVSDEAKAILRGALGLGEGDDSRPRILHAAKHVLKRKFGRGMAEKDQAAFKIAFVVFVVENLLAPRETDCIPGLLHGPAAS